MFLQGIQVERRDVGTTTTRTTTKMYFPEVDRVRDQYFNHPVFGFVKRVTRKVRKVSLPGRLGTVVTTVIVRPYRPVRRVILSGPRCPPLGPRGVNLSQAHFTVSVSTTPQNSDLFVLVDPSKTYNSLGWSVESRETSLLIYFITSVRGLYESCPRQVL